MEKRIGCLLVCDNNAFMQQVEIWSKTYFKLDAYPPNASLMLKPRCLQAMM
jgi:hypothetical protein